MPASHLRQGTASRLRFRAGEGRRARLTIAGEDVGEVGIEELSWGELRAVALPPGRRVPNAEGASARVHLDWPEGRFSVAATIRRSETSRDHATRLTLAVLPEASTTEELLETRTVPLEPGLTAFFARPFAFGQTLAAEVLRIGGTRIELRSSDPTLVVLPALPLELRVGGHRLRGRVLSATSSSRHVELALALEPLGRAVARAVVEHALLMPVAGSTITPRLLRAADLPTRSIRRVFRCREVLTHDAYLEVLRLRHLTYVAANKLPADSPLEAASSEGDRLGQVLGFYHGDRLVASVSLRFPGEESPVESVDRALGGFYPADLPPKRSIMEVIKLCIHPDYRHTDLMVGICEQISAILLSSGRTWFLAAADRWLVPRYEFVGYRKTRHHYYRSAHGYRRERGSPADERIDVLVSHPFRLGTFGFHGDPLRWNFFLRDVTDYALRSGALRWNAAQHGARALYTSLRPAASLVERVFVK